MPSNPAGHSCNESMYQFGYVHACSNILGGLSFSEAAFCFFLRMMCLYVENYVSSEGRTSMYLVLCEPPPNTKHESRLWSVEGGSITKRRYCPQKMATGILFLLCVYKCVCHCVFMTALQRLVGRAKAQRSWAAPPPFTKLCVFTRLSRMVSLFALLLVVIVIIMVVAFVIAVAGIWPFLKRL